MDTSTIEPRGGVGDLRLGMGPDRVLSLVGPPEETNDDPNCSIWYYLERGLSLTFEAVRGAWRLTSVDASGADVRLGGASVIGGTRDDVAAIAERMGLHGGAWSGDPAGESWLEFTDDGLSLWFSAGRLEEITVEVPPAERVDADDARRTRLAAPYVVPGATRTRITGGRRRMDDRVAVVLLAGATLFLALLALGGFRGALAERRAMRSMAGWPSVDGRVVRVDSEGRGDDTVYRAVVAYEVGRQSYEARETTTSDRPRRVGAHLAVRYPRTSPADGRVTGDAEGRFRASLIVGGVCAAGALAFLLGARLVARS
ncbi:Protein of unknown function DUF3592 [Gemmatirosa kalamazoonensis]|uniref:DUF3592 domain-containing protein n=1 Tax=Gemmatirosa kalamazoonensis TaxID=861299 RepID=W0RK15_9BACT|nr:DUF3592 domain-containing protein [Gemmatirosa kalamazoonensis]AHG89743.1 Protein of unknown function DUF3592 [Gemmatirosa kalamazoonensis]